MKHNCNNCKLAKLDANKVICHYTIPAIVLDYPIEECTKLSDKEKEKYVVSKV